MLAIYITSMGFHRYNKINIFNCLFQAVYSVYQNLLWQEEVSNTVAKQTKTDFEI